MVRLHKREWRNSLDRWKDMGASPADVDKLRHKLTGDTRDPLLQKEISHFVNSRMPTRYRTFWGVHEIQKSFSHPTSPTNVVEILFPMTGEDETATPELFADHGVTKLVLDESSGNKFLTDTIWQIAKGELVWFVPSATTLAPALGTLCFGHIVHFMRNNPNRAILTDGFYSVFYRASIVREILAKSLKWPFETDAQSDLIKAQGYSFGTFQYGQGENQPIFSLEQRFGGSRVGPLGGIVKERKREGWSLWERLFGR